MGSRASARGVRDGNIRAPWVPTTHPHHRGTGADLATLVLEILPSFGGSTQPFSVKSTPPADLSIQGRSVFKLHKNIVYPLIFLHEPGARILVRAAEPEAPYTHQRSPSIW
jgi:hypothetical protein